jgi:outer membrane protein OmpA-like peptidoglycan-associated protein
MFKNLFVAIPIAVMAVGGSTACATKKFVRTSVGEVNDKVDSVGRSLEETQERTRQNEAKITEVDQKAQAAAQAADQKATSAGSAAQQAQTAATQANSAATAAGSKADAVDKSLKRIVFEVVLSEDEGNFAFGKTMLPDEAKAKLDQMITQIKADPKGAFFEIEGHTDNVGDKMYNEKLGLERAESVKRYLYEQHQIPLHKMNVISYGEDKPVAPNKDRAGRAQNRRVVIKVLA